jgi:quercetin dioxygenase-like cupin family protein
MGAIFHVDPDELDWSDYQSDAGATTIRFKALTAGTADVPPVQYIEYGPGQTDPRHRHHVGEVFIVARGELWLDGVRTGPGGVVFVPPDTDYAVQAGDEGVRYFRVVTA